LRRLAAKARTRHELDQALRAKNVPEAVATEVLDRMAEVGLVDDGAFARDWVESRQMRRQLSGQALRRELESKGVAREEIDQALESVVADDEYDAARLLAERKGRSTKGLPREVRYRRLVGVLTRRGFGAGLTTRVVTEVLAGENH
jgi:regulatory protein